MHNLKLPLQTTGRYALIVCENLPAKICSKFFFVFLVKKVKKIFLKISHMAVSKVQHAAHHLVLVKQEMI